MTNSRTASHHPTPGTSPPTRCSSSCLPWATNQLHPVQVQAQVYLVCQQYQHQYQLFLQYHLQYQCCQCLQMTSLHQPMARQCSSDWQCRRRCFSCSGSRSSRQRWTRQSNTKPSISRPSNSKVVMTRLNMTTSMRTRHHMTTSMIPSMRTRHHMMPSMRRRSIICNISIT